MGIDGSEIALRLRPRASGGPCPQLGVRRSARSPWPSWGSPTGGRPDAVSQAV
ncbi:hypothetical protein QJS66_15310 [Kocuria rhizophila]|nr:hypothetical protein QJS66_15310 [Kocuria rhizophila]